MGSRRYRLLTISSDGTNPTTPKPYRSFIVTIGSINIEVPEWHDYRHSIISVVVDGHINAPQSMSGWFMNCESLQIVDFTGLDTSNVTNMSSMFYNCSSLTSLDLSSFDTSSVTNMSEMFVYCSSLTELTLPASFNTKKVENMSKMFRNCSSLASLTLPASFNTSSVTNMNQMFYWCKNLTALDLSSFNTSSVTNMGEILSGCSMLTTIQTPQTVGTVALPLPERFMYEDEGEDGNHTLINSISSADVNKTITRHEACSGGTATCTQLAECKICGNEYGDFGDHSFTVWAYDGTNHWHKCINCGESQGDEAAHSGTDDGDCTTAVTCSCGYEMKAAQTEHNFKGPWQSDSEGHWHECVNEDCTQNDTKENHSGTDDNDCTTAVTCSCGYVITAAGTAHNYSETWTTDENQHWHVCRNTGCTQLDTKADHEYTENIATETYLKSAATCTAKAVYYKSCVCGKYGTETFEYGEIAPHTSAEAVRGNEVAATCTQAGSYDEVVYCSICGEELSRTQKTTAINPDAHNYGQWQNEVAANCTETGTKGHKDCELCHKHFDSENVEITDLIIATNDNHNWDNGTITKQPTCTEAGEKTFTCTLNSDHTKTESIKELGHAEVTDNNAVAATCTQTGLTASTHCSVCDTVIAEQTTVAALGHKFGEWKTVTASTCTKGGEQERVCTNDSAHKEKQSIAAIGHTEVTDDAITPTCTESGKTAGKHCSVCNTVLVAQNTVSALGHNFGEWTVTKEATETEEGEERRVCSHDSTHIETRQTDKLVVPDNNDGRETPHGGLSAGAIAGIVIACILVALLATYIACYFALYRRGILLEGKFFDVIYVPMNAIFGKKEQEEDV